MGINYQQLRQQERLIRASGNRSSDKDEKLLELAMKYIDDQDIYDLDEFQDPPLTGYEFVPTWVFRIWKLGCTTSNQK